MTKALPLKPENEAGEALPRRSVIFVELAGGPTHFETYDPKPKAPSENRGNEMPCIGTVTARLQGAHSEGVPAYVGLQRTMR
jgi:hypothetical protein